MNKIMLISTDSYVLLEQELARIIKIDNKIIYNMNESSIDDVLEEAAYFSLFDDDKVIVAMNSSFFGKNKIKEEDSKKLLSYFEHPNEHSFLIFTTYETVDKRKGITKKIIEQNGYVELRVPKGYDLFNEIKKKFSKYKVSDEVIKYLISACLSSYDILCKEIDKLSLKYKDGDVISLSDIKKIVPMNYDDNVFSFVSKVVQKDLGEALRYLEELTYLKIDSIQLLSLLVREYRLMYYYKLLEGRSSSIIMRELQLQDWQLKKLIMNASLYHIDDLRDCLIKLADIDYKVKSGKEDKKMALESFIIDVCE